MALHTPWPLAAICRAALLLIMVLALASAGCSSSNSGAGGSGTGSATDGDGDGGTDDGGGTEPPTYYNVTGSVSGLEPGFPLTVTVNGTDLTFTENGSVTVAGAAEAGTSYSITLSPHPLMRCDGENLSGTVTDSDVIVTVVCEFLVFFAADDSPDLGGDFDLWVTDGTADGTRKVAEMDRDENAFPSQFAFFNGRLYFAAQAFGADAADLGVELFSYDGVSDPELVADLVSGEGAGAEPAALTVYDGMLYFTGVSDSGVEIYRTDGETGVEGLFAEDSTYALDGVIMELAVYDGKLFFSGDVSGGVNAGHELWSFTEADGFVLEADLDGDTTSTTPFRLTVANDALYFIAQPGSYFRIHAFDGSSAAMLGPVNATGNDWPDQFQAYNGDLYLVMSSTATGSELWRHDGTGFEAIDTIVPDSGSSFPESLTVYNGQLYFAASGSEGMELWRHDGSTTALVADAYAGVSGHSPTPLDDLGQSNHFNIVNGVMVYFGADADHGFNLWRSDGTVAGTELLKEICTACDAMHFD